MQIPLELWDEIISSCCVIQSLISSPETKQSPFKIWSNSIPNLNLIRVLGSKAVFLNQQQQSSKLDKKGWDKILVGFDLQLLSYCVFRPKTNSIIQSKHFKIFKNLPLSPSLPFPHETPNDSFLSINKTLNEPLNSPKSSTSSCPTVSPSNVHSLPPNSDNTLLSCTFVRFCTTTKPKFD